MKIGIRKPSISKSIKARTTGRVKRAIKKSVIPVYGKKGVGWVMNPKKAAYNIIYKKATIDAVKSLRPTTGSKTQQQSETKWAFKK